MGKIIAHFFENILFVLHNCHPFAAHVLAVLFIAIILIGLSTLLILLKSFVEALLSGQEFLELIKYIERDSRRSLTSGELWILILIILGILCVLAVL